MIDIEEPLEAQAWIADLESENIGQDFDDDLAAVLRVAAALIEQCICICSGSAALPYVTWLRDGMSMSGCLIIHLDPARQHLDSVVQKQLDSDIRVSSHYQAAREFCIDISRHRVDLLLLTVDDGDMESLEEFSALLNENALMIVLASPQTQEKLRARYSSAYFLAPVGGQGRAIMLARKGMQHQRVRRSERRGGG